MLTLKNIKKNYVLGNQTFKALDGIDIEFRKNEFVAILGASGSGKTTLLNIIGGLDRYTSGDLIINDKSTKSFKDADWDSYRNTAIGFVFQSYNLIPHLSILDNVEIALRLSGVGSVERKKRAKQALYDVGLIDHIHKRSNQLSGGQMQRVAIARALINNPAILLADEPTGALDSKTSEQIMSLIQDISKDRLVIMVTHNPEIASNYADRIIRLVDGKVVEDTHPLVSNTSNKEKDRLELKKVSMGFLTAVKSSFNNLLTKKGRSLITMLAGSIGIIGVALVLSLSTGMTQYVNGLQSDTLAGFPLTITEVVRTNTFGPGGGNSPFASDADIATEFPDEPIIYAYDELANTTIHTNVLDEAFLTYLDGLESSLYNSISTTKSLSMHILAETSLGTYTSISTNQSSGTMFGSSSLIFEVPNSPDFIQSQYDVLAGTYPNEYNELVLVIDSNNRLSVEILEALGVGIEENYTFNDFLGKTFKVIPNNTYYTENNGVYIPQSNQEDMYTSSDGITLEIVGIIRVNEAASSELLSTGIGYLTDLTDHMLAIESTSDIVTAQLNQPNTNVLTGMSFNTQVTYDQVMKTIGGDTTPTGVQIYPVSFDAKDEIKAYLDAYNVGKTQNEAIIYTDTAETISSTISSLINTITIVLAALAGVSLVVSSIMIGIITYVSVVERTKEIGIMRSIGARKRDISRIFNAETLLIGLASGIFGIIVTLIVALPANVIIENLIQVNNIVILTWNNALLLILLSAMLTLVAGLIPSRIAANKDPVVALRTE
ncbi:ABC transporter ATP-binding protein/permease [Paracholeplasma manati]|uniref:ATP-binding cassette domain-containing protein n=1 Tax=Paracholeplasma manati TaxID=591373 RepID=A0ABT2Y5P6_9MOLU|nr:ABC transporter ATP-binding protein/permease [Paracholeplasma manati]MCV2231315.1 ATP-binding cassette domain-containing protein [Paracholeplasma manati]MDG0888397.1 ATP-binding cassette domain-containing protein [Paracholeplasma manati]